MVALSIRQPWAELILRGVKTVEFRSRPTRIVGERFWIYASKGKATKPPSDGATKGKIWSRDLGIPQDALPEWMIELAEKLILDKLPTGVIVGSAVIERVTQEGERRYQWHLRDVERAAELRWPARHPQPVCFKPFYRK